MPKFYITLSASLWNGSSITGNAVMETLTEQPTLEDFARMKTRFNEIVTAKNLLIQPETETVTICVPMF